jgi:hypothetical protein
MRNMPLILIALLSLPTAAGAADPVAPPNQIAQAKILEWGWDTPSPTYVREHVKEMEKQPFDGLVMTLTANGKHDLSQRPARQNCFPSGTFGGKPLKIENYKESVEALRAIQFEKFTDNFLRCNVTPGDRDWFEEEFPAAANVAFLASVAHDCHLKGIMLDTEAYDGQLFNYKRQKQSSSHSLEDYRKQVRQRGREWMNAINASYLDITIIVSLAYSMAHFPDENAEKYQLLPDFLDGILEAAKPGAIVYDGWEWAYNFRTEKEFADTRKIIRETALTWTAVPDAMRAHWRASFGLWLDYDSHWDAQDFSKNFFTPAEFAYSVHEGLKYTDRYVWIWSQKPDWWRGNIPQAYIDALKQARQQDLPPPPARQK